MSYPRYHSCGSWRGCARAVHAAIHVAAENTTFKDIIRKMLRKIMNVSTFPGKLRPSLIVTFSPAIRTITSYSKGPRDPRGNSERGPRGPREILKGAPGAIN